MQVPFERLDSQFYLLVEMFEDGEQGSGLDEILSFVESSGDLIEVSKND